MQKSKRGDTELDFASVIPDSHARNSSPGAFTCSRLINGLALAGIEVDRKVLAEHVVHGPEAFNAVAAQVKAALPAAA